MAETTEEKSFSLTKIMECAVLRLALRDRIKIENLWRYLAQNIYFVASEKTVKEYFRSDYASWQHIERLLSLTKDKQFAQSLKQRIDELTEKGNPQ